MLSTTHTHHTKLKRQFNLCMSDAAYLELWDQVLCNTNKVLGVKPAKRRFDRLFQQKSYMGWSRKLKGAL